ncbi:beta-N-acetylglucosaminidase domain-containing protein [Collinsella sp. AGMB00827]|uniref:Beta-N-acetylglucosaminidase domain-containing protein n=1 Tax=Collinsella ureilytica TaxID=2869515 RepID=A0ABS7MK86_9ACTN|nr:beta-N-acetylglucosaminidase domain-containing protein [Collinsella urealyticum]MBY4797778.1 beta-N-acetylglucosaminidase domain-containing protein [Collinsella urealyticum]
MGRHLTFTRAARLAFTVLTAFFALVLVRPAAAETSEYQIYPTPHDITYNEGTATLGSTATLVFDAGIDEATQARATEALRVKNIEGTVANAAGEGTNLLVGIVAKDGTAQGVAERTLVAAGISHPAEHFAKTDAYSLDILANKDGSATIVVIGADTDAAFYGLSTLYQIFQQLDGASVRTLTLEDHADIITRGFIEGYYGEPWSTEDRVNLMKWGGYYKLNAYMYAPKDDPKHNSAWRDPYTDEELVEKIEPLATAGNNSKCRFVFALHPFMHNPITSANYDETVPILKEKFKQVMDHGVRQICILADDARNQGADLYTRLLRDMTDWVHTQQQATGQDGQLLYPGLKDTIIFCPVNYMGFGEGWYANLPANIQVINTGGRVWGKATNSFTTRFQSTSGVAPFMWINWPCTDNTKNSLSMGGYKNALGDDVRPGSVKGVVLNPMQQSEPSKAGIFMNADFSWNLWKSYDHADQVWQDSFSYVDHGSPLPTEASNALRALSNNMRYYKGGGVDFVSEESELDVDGRPVVEGARSVRARIEALSAKLTSGSLAAEDIAEGKALFSSLLAHVDAYTKDPGNAAMAAQIEPFMGAWRDMCTAAIGYFDAYEASLTNDATALAERYFAARAAYMAMDGHGYPYVNHTEYASVGNRYIKPFVKALNKEVTERAQRGIDPMPTAPAPESQATASLVGLNVYNSNSVDRVVDGSESTYGWFHHNNGNIQTNDAVMVSYEPAKTIGFVRLVQDSGDKLVAGALEYTEDGSSWHKLADISGEAVQELRFPNVVAKAIRVRATQGTDRWWKVAEIMSAAGKSTGDAGAIVSDASDEPGISGEVRNGSGSIHDGTVELKANTYLAIDLGAVRTQVMVNPHATTLPDGAQLVASVNRLEWTPLVANKPQTARFVGVRMGKKDGNVAFKNFALSYAFATDPSIDASSTLRRTDAMDVNAIFDGKLSTAAKNAQTPRTDDTIVFDLGMEREINSIAYYITEASLDPVRNGVIEASMDKSSWTPVLSINGTTPVSEDGWQTATAKDAPWLTHDADNPGYMYTASPKTEATKGNVQDPNGTDPLSVKARYLRLRFTAGFSKRWVEISEIVINNGEYVSNYRDADISASSLEERGHSPHNAIDGDLNSTWVSSGKTATGEDDTTKTLTYSISEPLDSDDKPMTGVRIISLPSAAPHRVRRDVSAQAQIEEPRVYADLYTDNTYTKTDRVELGYLDGRVKDFGFGGKVAQRVVIDWSHGGAAAPEVGEIYLIGAASKVQAPALPEQPVFPKDAPDPGETPDPGKPHDPSTDEPGSGETPNPGETPNTGETPDPHTPGSSETHEFMIRFMDGEKLLYEVQVADGKQLAVPTAPTREGYRFVGWELPDGTLFDFSKPVSADMTLVARFKKKDETKRPRRKKSAAKSQLPRTGGNSLVVVAVSMVGGMGALWAARRRRS